MRTTRAAYRGTQANAAPFHVMAKPIGPICNLDCKYCFYLDKENLYPGNKHWLMRDEVLESYIRQYIESQPTAVVTFAWQGGEPTLLGVDYFRRVIELQKRWAGGKMIENTLQTNGTTLDQIWCDFLTSNRFLIGISIDGPRDLHDGYRVDKGGQPTFDRVLRGMALLKKHGVEFNTLTVVHKTNSYAPLEVYRFLKEVGSGFMQFIPAVERADERKDAGEFVGISKNFEGPAQVSDWSVEPVQYGRFLCSIFDEWVRNDVGKYFVQLFDVSLESWLGLEPSLCIFKRTCGRAVALEHNGDVYSCDHFVDPGNELGNIMKQPLRSLLTSSQQRQFGTNKEDGLPQYCRACEVRFACNGECPKNRFARTPEGESGLNYLCAAYKMFFHHIDECMSFMAKELCAGRPPANVMNWLKKREPLC